MAAQRFLSGLLLFFVAAAALVLLMPDLFPDIRLPAGVAEAPQLRGLLGALLAAITGFIVFAIFAARRQAAAAAARRVLNGPAFDDRPATADLIDAERALASPEPAPAQWEPGLRLVQSEADSPSEPEPHPALEELSPPQAVASPEVVAPPEFVAANESEPPALDADPHPGETAAPGEETPDPGVQEPLVDQKAETAEPEEADAADAAEPADEASIAAPAVAAAISSSDQHRLVELVREAEAAQSEGRADDALALYDTALTQARAIHAADPTQPGSQLALAETLSRVASLEENDHAPDVALQHHEEALALHRAVAGAAPDNIEYSEGLALALNRAARAREARGQDEHAQELYGEAARTIERLAWLHPGEDRYEGLLKAARSRFQATAENPA